MTEPVAIVEFDPTEGGKYCGAKTRLGAKHPHCRQRAGHRTDHVGQGRCTLHGGSTPLTTGRGSRNVPRYARILRPRVKELIEQFEADPDPLNILSELAFARAVLVDFVERYDAHSEALIAWHNSFTKVGMLSAYAGKPIAPVEKPTQILDVSDAMRHIDTITKIVERIEKIRAANAISRQDLVRLMGQLGNAVERHVRSAIPDDERALAVLRAIRQDWLTLAVA
jgi:hypothetical protein